MLCYLLASILTTPVVLGKEGSGVNYYLEVVAILAPLLTGLIGLTLPQPARLAEVLVLLCVSLLAGTRFAAAAPIAEDFERDRTIQDYLRKNLLAGSEGIGDFTGDLMRARIETPIPDFYQYTWLTCVGKMPPSNLLALFQRKRFAVILVATDLHDELDAHRPNENCMPEVLHRSILENYRFGKTFHLPSPQRRDGRVRLYAWVPRETWSQ
jgi:hypothetical protein